MRVSAAAFRQLHESAKTAPGRAGAGAAWGGFGGFVELAEGGG